MSADHSSGDDSREAEDASGTNREQRGLTWRRRIGLPLGPLLLLVTLATDPPGGMEVEAWHTAGVALFMAVWWLTEALPLAGTALLPLVIFPLLEIAGMSDAAAPYARPVIFLFLGGFMLAAAVEKWGLHRRLALRLIRLVGTRPLALIAGFMVAAAFLSMWVSNTATAVMMLPIGLSVIDLVLRDESTADDPGRMNFPVALMLGIAYACSIGGAATLIGTPPNALLAGYLEENFDIQIGFSQWMMVGVPLAVIMLPVTWVLLTRVIFPVKLKELPGGSDLIDREIEKLGRASRGERIVGGVFLLTALAWITRPLVEDIIPGLTDAGIAVAAAVVLFALPVHPRRGEFALDWKSAKRIPWSVLLLFGGGLSLAEAITRSGLASWIGEALTFVEVLPLMLILMIIALVIIFMTEVMSNTAAAATFLPVLAALAVSIGQDPLLFTATAALAASCAFMLPVATPPNAIVYSSSFIRMPHMARAGIILNVLFAVVIPLIAFAALSLFFGVEPGEVPGWADD